MRGRTHVARGTRWGRVIAAVTTLLCGTVHGAPTVLTSGRFRAEFTDRGVWSVREGGAALVSRSWLVVAAPSWAASGGQDSAAPMEIGARSAAGPRGFAGRITEPLSTVAWEYEERAVPIDGGFRFSYTVRPTADCEVGEVALFVELPLAAWRGQRVQLWPGREAALPTERGARHFLNGPARRAVFGVRSERQLTLDFPQPALCRVQDARDFGAEAYQIYMPLASAGRVAAGTELTLSFDLLPDDQRDYPAPQQGHSSREPLSIGPLKLSSPRVPRYGVLEIDVPATAVYDTPFDADQVSVDAHVTCPSGRTLAVPGFFTRDYAQETANGVAVLEPVGEPGWKVRLAPAELGPYSVQVTVRDRSGEMTSEAAGFECIPSDSPGYVRVSARDAHYFEFDSGKPYFAVGENVCVYHRGISDFERWFGRLGEAGANYARVWAWGSSLGIEWGPPGVYRLDSAWELDQVLHYAEADGIYVKLCLEAWRRFEGRQAFYPSDAVHPYWSRNGGPCDTEIEFFTNPEAQRMFRNRLRYVVARWGYSTHLLAWEFWNEINCVAGCQDVPQPVIDWTAEMARYLRRTDPWDHMVVNSLGSFVVKDALWELPEMDFAQVHGYWHRTLPASRELGKDMAAMVPEWLSRISQYGKPALFAEYGLVNDNWGHSPLANDDKDGVELHNGLWSAMMSGAAGTAMLWWWDVYVDAQDLYHVFTPVARFAADVPWTTAGFRPLRTESDEAGLRVLGLASDRLAILWLQNKGNTWWNVVHHEQIEPIRNARVVLESVADGEWTARWYDTWSGRWLGREVCRAEGGRLELAVPELARDVAVRLER